MRTPLPLPRLLMALGLCCSLVGTGCGDDTPSADPARTSSVPPRDSTPPTTQEGPDLEPCGLVPGPIMIEGVLGRVTGGFAGIDETSFVSATCAADPIPVAGVDWDAIEIVETETDCDDCADALSGATSGPVEVTGELVPVDQIDLAPGETLAPGDLVLVIDDIQP